MPYRMIPGIRHRSLEVYYYYSLELVYVLERNKEMNVAVA